jgi:hypothetical protein
VPPLRSKFLSSCFSEQLFGNGFAACCEDAALPFRKRSVPLILGCALASFRIEGEAQILESLETEGQSRILTTGGEADAINLFGCGSAALRSRRLGSDLSLTDKSTAENAENAKGAQSCFFKLGHTCV